MSARIIDGVAAAQRVCEELLPEIARLKTSGVVPKLCVILVGEDPPSLTYVANKAKRAVSLGIDAQVHRLSADAREHEIISRIEALNADPLVHGILVQLPLPAQVKTQAMMDHIAPEKDVDGFHAYNAGLLMQGRSCLTPCTPQGVLRLIKDTGLPIAGKQAVVVGRSIIVGRPTAMLLMMENATVTLCHSHTENLDKVVQRADILVAACGKPGLITGDMIKPGAVVIDVGITRIDGKLHGDVAFEGASERAGFITPVPGGVGPMTIAMLMKNTVQIASRISCLNSSQK